MLRKATPDDANKIIELEKLYYDGYFISEDVIREWTKTGRYYVIERDYEIVGSMYFEFLKDMRALPWEHKPVDEEPNYIYISEVAVASAEIHTELFTKVLGAAHKHNVKTILWLTGEKASHDKIEQNFLKENGFELKHPIASWECAPGRFISDHSIWVKELN